MKNGILGFLLAISISANAQQNPVHAQPFQKGTWLIGAQATYQRGFLWDRALHYENMLVAQGYGGYFVANKVLVGLSGSRFQEAVQSFRAVTYAVGPMVRYQFTTTRLSPFVVASYQIGQLDSKGDTPDYGAAYGQPSIGIDNSTRIYCRSLGVGLSVGVLASLRLDLGVAWQDRVVQANFGIYPREGHYQAQAGLNYQFGRRRHP